MSCWLCGSTFDTERSAADARPAVQFVASQPAHGIVCGLCGVALPTRESAALFLQKLRQLAQFGLTSNVRLLSEPSRTEN